MAKLNKGQRQLHHTSASSIGIAEGFPNVKEGNEGDITLRHIRGKGVYIFAKFRNRWYSRQLLSGQGRNTGVKESNLENPTPGQQLNFYDSQSGQNLPVDVSEVFTVNFGSPGKLTLGSKKAKSSGSAAGNPGRLQLGDDKANIGHLALGDAGTNVNVDNEFGSISVGAIDDGHLGFLKLFAGSISQVNRRTILKAGGSLGADITTTFRIESENSYIATDGDSHGALLKLRRIGTGATVETETKMGSLYCQGGADDPKLYFKNNAGTIYDLTTASTLSSYLPLAGGTVTGTVHMDDNVKIEFGDADEYIKGDGTDLIISSTSNVDFNNSRLADVNRVTFNAGGSQQNFLDEDDMTSNSNSAAPSQQSVKAYVDTNRRWHQHTGGYKLNNSSSTIYYFQYRFGDHNWSNSDSSPTTISVYDSYASVFIAPYAGTLDKISVHGYAADTGATDPFKFYVFKGTTAGSATNLSLTQIGITAEVTPADTRQFVVNTDISSSNTFAENDSLFVMYKKESSSASQDLYFSVTISGVYTA